jgi:ketosteroid isomerase-like protein
LRTSLPSWGVLRPQQGSWRAAPAVGFRAKRTFPDADLATQREVVDAFLAASRDGDFDTLLAVLDPDVVLRIDGGAVRAGLSREVRGARAVAEQTLTFSRLSPFVRPALVNGAAGVVVAPRGRPFSVMGFTIRGGKIVEVDILADPARLSRLDVSDFDD